MNGNRYFLDTNSIIALLKSNQFIEEKLAQAEWIGTSVICVIEFLSFPNLSLDDKELLNQLLNRVELIGITKNFSNLDFIATFKRETKLKLPDAILACHAIQNKALLVTSDKHFHGIDNLALLDFS